MDHITAFRQTYLCAAPHTFFTATIWLAAALTGDLYSKSVAIMIFILGASLTFPGGELVRKFMNAPNLLTSDNKLGRMFMFSAFGIPLCYPLIYLVCKNNLNYFFPAFSILVGAHYLLFVYGYGKNTFALLSFLLVFQGSYVAFKYHDLFGVSGYATAGILYFFGVVHLIMVRAEAASAQKSMI